MPLLVGPVPIAVHDFGGQGQDVLLLPGGGRTYADWETIGGLFATGGFRAVAMDLRGHGDSGAGPWTWDAALDDVQTVVDSVPLQRPIVIGHALGGMVAALWASKHAECPLAVNIDGHGTSMLRLSPEVAAIPDGVANLRAQFDELGQGLPPFTLEVTRAIDALDMLPVYRSTQCPLLAVSATGTIEFADLLDEPGASAWRAGRTWLMATLVRLALQVPLFDHAILAGDNALHRDDPISLYGLITRSIPHDHDSTVVKTA